MNKFLCLLSVILFASQMSVGQVIQPENITIIRDAWGVPHIYTKTDAEAAYGLAWAQAEDNFYDMQETMLAVRGLLGEVKGKKGAIMDAIGFMVKAKELVEENFDQAFSPKFKAVLNGFEQGVNRYAELHPEEVRHKKLFPIKGKEIIMGYVMNMTFLTNTHHDLLRILEDNFTAFDYTSVASGSNSFAISPTKTKDGKTYLVSNTHQPLTGPVSWYEVHIETEEGWNFLGATMPAGLTPFVGTNKNLGWTHTTNQDNFHDVFQLKMHPKEKNKYYFDGKWMELEERTLKLKVKVGMLKIPVKRTFFYSVYGPTFKNKSGFYALRFPSNMVMGQAEQWYWMNKAENYEEFRKALDMQQIANQNITYADKTGRIFFLNNGLFPERNSNYLWEAIMPGDTSATLWQPSFRPLDSLIFVKNPDCGYVFNMNNTAFDCTCSEENPRKSQFPQTMGILEASTARSIRFHQLIQDFDKLNMEDLKAIKYDSQYSFPMYTRTLENMDVLRQLSPSKYPELAEAIAVLQKWDGGAEIDNRQAALVTVACNFLQKYLRDNVLADQNNTLPEEEYAKALGFAQQHLRKHFGTLEPELGQVQKHVRGDKVLPIWGAPEVLTQMYLEPFEKGMYQTAVGESYIMFATYGKDGVEKIETVVPYGASNKPESPHYDDQMELFVNKGLKEMTMDKEKIRANSERIYHPQ